MALFAPVIIIGAGPAGLAAAIAAGRDALILERNPQAGKKLLLSGNGQCNFTNNLDREAFLKACGRYSAFLKPALYKFDNHDFIELLEHSGCPTITRPDGKVFPASMNAANVRDALLSKALSAGAKIVYNSRVTQVEKAESFILATDLGESHACAKIILAGGGASYPQTGSDGSVYALAQALGHGVIAPKPALAAITIKNFQIFQNCAGVSLQNVRASFHTPGGRINAQGDLLFTHTGLSGPLILDNSWQLNGGDLVAITLVPRAEDRVPEILKLHPRQSLLQALRRFAVAESLLRAVLASSGIDPEQKCAELHKETRVRVIQLLTQLEFEVKTVEGMQSAMATSGGIPLSEVTARSMASRFCAGLHFAGEILDYNLPTGGFNLQAAVSTGWLAGNSALK